MNELTVQTEAAAPVDQIVGQMEQIARLTEAVMREGVHYGVIPGCGDRPTLLQPGAQKLALAFGLRPEFTVQRRWQKLHVGGVPHLVVSCTCRAVSRRTGATVSYGVGMASTLEDAHRWRYEAAGPVPQEYWASRDPSLLGGGVVRKVDNQWVVCHRHEQNPANSYNTVAKMAKKRAFVDAILLAVAASDKFTQDIEDVAPAGLGADSGAAPAGDTGAAAAPAQSPPATAPPSPQPQPAPVPDAQQQAQQAQTRTTAVPNLLTGRIIRSTYVVKQGVKGNRRWTLYEATTDQDESVRTFDDNHYARLMAAAATGTALNLTVRPGRYGLDLVAIEEVPF